MTDAKIQVNKSCTFMHRHPNRDTSKNLVYKCPTGYFLHHHYDVSKKPGTNLIYVSPCLYKEKVPTVHTNYISNRNTTQ